MGIIKAADTPAAITPFSMKDIEQQAQAIMLRARQQAEQLLAEAKVEGQRLRTAERALGFTEGRGEGLARGREEGRAEGMAEAMAEHRSSLTRLITALHDAALQVEQSRRELQEQALTEVVRLAITIAGRITKRQASLDPGVLSENIIAAVKLAVHSTDLRIAIHPGQRHLLLEILPKLSLQWPSLQHVELIEDPTLEAGGCRIYTRHGMVDADLNQQLDRIAAELLPCRSAAEGPTNVPAMPPPREQRVGWQGVAVIGHVSQSAGGDA
jgi:flagellar assembly protein FliH